MDTAHDYSQGLGIKVAVLDTGVDPTAPALQGRLKGGYDYIDDDSTPTDVRMNVDSNGNGTVDESMATAPSSPAWSPSSLRTR